MAGTERGGQHQPRRFITRHNVEDAAASSQPIRVQGRDVLTDEAAQRAIDLGVRIERDRSAATMTGSSVMTSPSPALSLAASDDDLRQAVRAAVVAELGSEAPGLDLAIDRVMRSRSR